MEWPGGLALKKQAQVVKHLSSRHGLVEEGGEAPVIGEPEVEGGGMGGPGHDMEVGGLAMKAVGPVKATAVVREADFDEEEGVGGEGG